jgi:ABC-type dipeptide/oligopeptide/nickel transport system ATPase subunit
VEVTGLRGPSGCGKSTVDSRLSLRAIVAEPLLALRPRYVICDEMTSMLDASTTALR